MRFATNLNSRRPLFAVLCALVPALLGCTSEQNDGRGNSASAREWPAFAGKHPIRAVCTTGMVADVVRNVAGGHVAVQQIMGEGIDPHLFRVTPDISGDISRADVIFYSGLHLEGRMTELFEAMAEQKPTIAITSSIAHDKLLAVGPEVHDPHVWFDVGLWSQTIESVRSFLVKFDPAHAADYEKRAADYKKQLTELDAECRTRLAAIPKASRVLVTAHDAFHYFGRAYDVEVRAVQGVSTESEAGVKEINELVDFIVERKIKAVFIETSVSDRNVKSLIDGCKAQRHDVKIGGELFSDSMGKLGTAEGTYVGMVRHNVDVIVKALE